MKGHCQFDTPIGTCAIAWTDRGIRAFALPGSTPAAARRRIATATGTDYASPPRGIAGVIARAIAHLSGRPTDLSDARLDLSWATPFERAVYAATRELRLGRLATYGEIARRIHQPRAARAVGAALGRNQIALLIPCHRVVASDGRLCGFSADAGIGLKQRLISIELAPPIIAAADDAGARA